MNFPHKTFIDKLIPIHSYAVGCINKKLQRFIIRRQHKSFIEFIQMLWEESSKKENHLHQVNKISSIWAYSELFGLFLVQKEYIQDLKTACGVMLWREGRL